MPANVKFKSSCTVICISDKNKKHEANNAAIMVWLLKALLTWVNTYIDSNFLATNGQKLVVYTYIGSDLDSQ